MESHSRRRSDGNHQWGMQGFSVLPSMASSRSPPRVGGDTTECRPGHGTQIAVEPVDGLDIKARVLKKSQASGTAAQNYGCR